MLSSRTAQAQVVWGKVVKAAMVVKDPVTELSKGESTTVRSRDLGLPGPNNNP